MTALPGAREDRPQLVWRKCPAVVAAVQSDVAARQVRERVVGHAPVLHHPRGKLLDRIEVQVAGFDTPPAGPQRVKRRGRFLRVAAGFALADGL
jgi:hypothetical protein